MVNWKYLISHQPKIYQFTKGEDKKRHRMAVVEDVEGTWRAFREHCRPITTLKAFKYIGLHQF